MRREDGRWLMHKRPPEKHHGGLWEFPGGKVEALEKPVEALIRELREELGVSVKIESSKLVAVAFEDAVSGHAQIVIELYICRHWDGEPQALEGGKVGWFAPEEVVNLEKPPLDIALAAQLFAKEAG